MCETRADGLGLQAVVADEDKFEFGKDVCGVLIQYPDTNGTISDYKVRGQQGYEQARVHLVWPTSSPSSLRAAPAWRPICPSQYARQQAVEQQCLQPCI